MRISDWSSDVCSSDLQLAAERRARAASIRPQAAFDLASLPQAARPYRAWASPSVDVVASAGVVSDKRGGSYVQGRYEIFAAGEVLAQSFDARLSSDNEDRKSTRLNSSHSCAPRMPSSA